MLDQFSGGTFCQMEIFRQEANGLDIFSNCPLKLY